MKTQPLDRWFVAQVTAKSGTGAGATYAFEEWWLDSSGAAAKKDGGRSNSLTGDPANSLGAELAVGDLTLCRPADGAAGRKWELVPFPLEGAPAGGCAGCGWVAGLTDLDCLLATVVERLGRCACAGGTNSGPVYLASGDGATWADAATVTICGVEYSLTFSKEGCDGPCLTLTAAGGSATTYTTTRDCCGPNYAIFSIGTPLVCTGTTDATAGPAGNVARVKVGWICCPAAGYAGPGYYCVRDAGTSDPCVAVEVLSAADVCADAVEICSGPYSTLEEAQAACPTITTGGQTCAEATPVAVGAWIYGHAAASGVPGYKQHFCVPVTAGQQYKMDVFSADATAQFYGYWATTCDSLVDGIGHGTSSSAPLAAPDCYTYDVVAPAGATHICLRVENLSSFVATDFGFKVSAGTC